MVRWLSAAIAALSLTGVSAKIYWDPVGNTCDPLAGKAGAPNLDDAVKKVWQEIEGMASNALQSMNDIDSGPRWGPRGYLPLCSDARSDSDPKFITSNLHQGR